MFLFFTFLNFSRHISMTVLLGALSATSTRVEIKLLKLTYLLRELTKDKAKLKHDINNYLL